MLVLRNVRRLPPFMRVVSILALLFLTLAVAVLALLLAASWPLDSPMPSGISHRLVLPFDLGALGLACYIVVNTYCVRFLQPEKETFPLRSWQSQAWALALLAALPICAFVVVLVLPPTTVSFWLGGGLSVFAFTVLGFAKMRSASAKLKAAGE